MDPTSPAGGSATNPISVIGDGPLACAIRTQHGPGFSHTGTTPVLVIDHGDDARTIAALRPALDDLSTSASPPTIVAQIADRRLRRAVQSRSEAGGIAPRPVIVGTADLVAEHFVLAENLVEIAYWRNQSRLHVALVGFDHVGQSFLDALATTGIAGEFRRPLIHIVTTDEAGTRAFLHREMPEIDKSAEIIVSACALTDLGEPEYSPLVKAENTAPLTAIVLLLGNEGDTLLASAAIANLQDRHGFANAALYIGGAGSEEACALTTPMRQSRNLGRKIGRISDLAAIDRLVEYVLHRRDALAKLLHKSYLREFGGETTGGTPWNVLPETYRRANRRAAWHLAQKLWTMGLSVPDDPQAIPSVDPFTYNNAIKPLIASSTEDETIRRLARLEHERWCAERRLDGWQHGDVRDDTRRRHPSLVSFDSPRLTTDDIDKNIGQIRFVLESMLKPAPGGATARIVVGVVATPSEAQPGVPLVTLVEQLGAEPHRTIILLSPLIDERELAAVLALTDAIDRRGQHLRFIVPEWYPGNRTIRDEAVSRRPELRSLLEQPHVRIAPIGPAGFFKNDVWEDPSELDSARKALASYVWEHSHALVAIQ